MGVDRLLSRKRRRARVRWRAWRRAEPMALLEKRGPTRGELRWFGLIFAGFFALLGAMSWWRSRGTADHHATAIVFWCIGAIVALIYYLVRPIQRPFYDLVIFITYPIG